MGYQRVPNENRGTLLGYHRAVETCFAVEEEYSPRLRFYIAFLSFVNVSEHVTVVMVDVPRTMN